jgi:magnesium transporter
LLHDKLDQELRLLLLHEDSRVIADVIDALEHGKRKTFAMLTPEKQAKVLLRLSEGSRDAVLPRLPNATIARLLHFFDEDDATDILQSLPQKRHAHILGEVQESRRKRIEKLLTFDPETAGGLMDLNFIELDPQTPIHTVIDAVQTQAKSQKQIPVVLLQTAKGMRWIPPRVLISGARQAPAVDLSQPVSVIVHSMDREDVLERMSKENTDITCVTDAAGKMIGVIHANDLLRIAEAEASEDVYKMGAVGFIGPNYLESKFTTIWRKRVGWLSFLFVAELFTFTALSHFESSIAAITALALFVPLCISTGGNSGSQAATLITRAMALGHVTTRDWLRVLRREFIMGIALGVALGIVGLIRAILTPQHILGATDRWMIGLVIGQSVAVICLWGTLVGSMLPLLFKKLGFDPGYASSPFVATFVDVTGIVLYFSIANVFIF